MRPFDTIHLSVTSADGLTDLGALTNARNIQWQEALNHPGSVTFEVPMDDAATALLVDRRIVKCAWFRDSTNVASFACRIQGEAVQIAADGNRWLRFENMPGLMSLLSDAVVYPEYGYTGTGIEKRVTSPDRHAGYMSASGGAWYRSADWVAPPTPRTWGTGAHGKKPAGFKAFDPTAQWISPYDPDVSQTASAVSYGRGAFYASDPMDVRIMYAFDDYGDLWVDGQQVVTADRTQHNQWVTDQTVDVRVSAGEHVVAFYNSNAPYVSGHDNPVAAILSVRQLDSKGNPTGSPLLNTNATDWQVNDGTNEPAYRKAQILLRFFAEAADRGVLGITTLNHGWTDTDDSNGSAWSDLAAFVFPIATTTLLDIALQLCEQGMDARTDASTMTLKLYKRLGTDRSGSVALTPGDAGGTLKSYALQKTPVQYTSVLTQLSTGEWVVTSDAGQVSSVGLIESGVSLGTVSSASSAATVANRQLETAAYPAVGIEIETAMSGGPIPYVDYDLGDTITVPGLRNSGTMKARVMAITVDWSEENVRVWPEVLEDRS